MAYKLLFQKHETDSRVPTRLGFAIDGDSQMAKDNRFCVADGVTRDFKDGSEFKLPHSLSELHKTLIYYPNILKLKKVSDLCTKLFVTSDNKDLYSLVNEINNEIALVNDFPCDYLGNDYYGCTAAGGIIEDGYLQMFNVGDSNILLFDNNLDILFRTVDDYTNGTIDRNKYIYSSDMAGKSWSDNSCRAAFRKAFRNTENPGAFTVLTGENVCPSMTHYYSQPLDEAVFILALTDGYLPIVNDKKKLEALLSGKLDDTIGHERTIIGYEKVKSL